MNQHKIILSFLVLPLCLSSPLQAQFFEQQKLTASDGGAFDDFGLSVCINDNLVIVGARYSDAGIGSAYIYELDQDDPSHWTEVAKLSVLAEASRLFGQSVSINGDTAVVGVQFGDTTGIGTGSGYIFCRNHGGVDNWGEVAKLSASDADNFDQFGISVSISGDTVIVGALENNSAGHNAGAAYIFQRHHGGTDKWGEVSELIASDATAGDRFGTYVSISDDLAIVGSPFDNARGIGSGSVYIFQRNRGGANNWGEMIKLTASSPAALFGTSVSISGDMVIVGAVGGGDGGSAYIFYRNQGGADNWGEVTKLTASDAERADNFGISVSINGDTAIVGSRYDDDGGNASGSAYIYRRNRGGANNWGEESKLVASDADSRHLFGNSVSISEQTVIVGAAGNDDFGLNSGSAYIFVNLCGDGTVDLNEECDDGNLVSGDGCDADCFIELGACCMETFCSEVAQVDCEADGGSFLGFGSDCGMYDAEPGVIGGGSNPCAQLIGVDFKPGGCPNSLNPRSKGVVSIAIVGSATLDVSMVDLDSLSLVRADGVGGVSLPIVRRIGAGAMIEDVSTPSGPMPCVCNDLGSDGIDDLTLKFWTGDLNRTLLLEGEPRDTKLELMLRGSLIDGTTIEGVACVVIRSNIRVWDASSSRSLKK